ncbi:hypothetical protein KSP39_PZI018753 [Platanthera zijinensis]|uniref:Uncharacterized protein n=1 Tax=Platanthera zijinensis TaxID=2320716 RepID=A0AAP0B3Y8_9ASPA
MVPFPSLSQGPGIRCPVLYSLLADKSYTLASTPVGDRQSRLHRLLDCSPSPSMHSPITTPPRLRPAQIKTINQLDIDSLAPLLQEQQYIFTSHWIGLILRVVQKAEPDPCQMIHFEVCLACSEEWTQRATSLMLSQNLVLFTFGLISKWRQQRGFQKLYTLNGGISHYLMAEGSAEWVLWKGVEEFRSCYCSNFPQVHQLRLVLPGHKRFQKWHRYHDEVPETEDQMDVPAAQVQEKVFDVDIAEEEENIDQSNDEQSTPTHDNGSGMSVHSSPNQATLLVSIEDINKMIEELSSDDPLFISPEKTTSNSPKAIPKKDP